MTFFDLGYCLFIYAFKMNIVQKYTVKRRRKQYTQKSVHRKSTDAQRLENKISLVTIETRNLCLSAFYATCP